jgi:predicted trehalose synthase
MNEIFSEKVVTSRRTYFFDVKETKEAAMYLVIGELTQFGSETERHRIMVFEESVDNFVSAFEKALDFIKRTTRERSPGGAPDDRQEVGAESAKGERGKGFMGIIERMAGKRSLPEHTAEEGSLREILERVEAGVDEIRRHFR